MIAGGMKREEHSSSIDAGMAAFSSLLFPGFLSLLKMAGDSPFQEKTNSSLGHWKPSLFWSSLVSSLGFVAFLLIIFIFAQFSFVTVKPRKVKVRGVIVICTPSHFPYI